MFGKFKRISILQYIYYNYFCKNIVRNNGHKLYPGRNSIISISRKSSIILDGDLYLNDRKIKNSKAEAYLVTNGNAKLHIKGDVRLRYGTTIQVNNGAVAEFGSFSCNANVNIQCNKRIVIGNDCMIGRNVSIFDSAYHPTGTSINNMSISQEEVIIGDHVWLGANAFVMQGSTIKNGAIIGTNANVSGEIQAASLVTPVFDKPTITGMLWARSMNDKHLNEAKKYGYQIEEQNKVKDIDTNKVLENEKIILEALKQRMGNIDFENEKALVDNKVFDSLTLITVVSILSDIFNYEIPFTEINAYNFNSVHNMALMITKSMNDSTKLVTSEKNTATDITLEPLVLNVEDTQKAVVQRIFEYAGSNPGEIAIIANEKETTYQELCDMILSIGQWLKSRGITRGNCVAVEAVHEDICVACYYAVHLIGAILVPMENGASEERFLEIAHETKSALIISKNKIDTDIDWVTYQQVAKISHDSTFSSNKEIEYPDIDMACEMVFTTGTTGKSKGVLMTHRNISWYSYSVAKCVQMKKGNRFLLTTPLNHAGGIRRTHLSLANGCCMVYMDGLSDLGKYFKYIEEYGVTSLYLPPLAIRILLTRTGTKLANYKNQIDFVYSSSSALPEGDSEKLKNLLPKTRLYNAYEASETPGVSVYDYNTLDSLKNCLGKANDGVEIAILTDEGNISSSDGIEGQICVKSKMNMKEYYLEPELTSTVWKDGWFVSNDLGKMNSDGYIFYNGRKGDVINIGGYKISPTDVEEVALLSGMVNECICIEDFDEFKIPYLKLLVVVDNKESFDAIKLNKFIANKLEAYKVPRKIECTDAIEKTFNGKLNRKAYKK